MTFSTLTQCDPCAPLQNAEQVLTNRVPHTSPFMFCSTSSASIYFFFNPDIDLLTLFDRFTGDIHSDYILPPHIKRAPLCVDVAYESKHVFSCFACLTAEGFSRLTLRSIITIIISSSSAGGRSLVPVVAPGLCLRLVSALDLRLAKGKTRLTGGTPPELG